MEYFAQWQSPELVGPIIRKEISAQQDPQWASFGATTPQEYEFWSWRACGMACLKSILAEWHQLQPTMMILCEEVLSAGGYRFRPDGGLDGLTYQPFVEYLKRRWGIAASVLAPLSLPELRRHVAGGDVVLASVSPQIRRPNIAPQRRGGHLVLVHDLDPDGVIFNNPSGDLPSNQQNAYASDGDFGRFFAGRGVLVFR